MYQSGFRIRKSTLISRRESEIARQHNTLLGLHLKTKSEELEEQIMGSMLDDSFDAAPKDSTPTYREGRRRSSDLQTLEEGPVERDDEEGGDSDSSCRSHKRDGEDDSEVAIAELVSAKSEDAEDELEIKSID